MAKMKKLTHDMVHEMVQNVLSPDKGARPDALRTLMARAKARNRLTLDKQARR